jgi:hypothetical protein
MQLQFRSREEYSKWCKSGQKPDDIPADPAAVYKDQWKGWGDWLGTGYIIPANRTYRSFTEARAHTHTLHLDSTDKWFEYCKSGNKPDDIPANPNVVYEDEWIGWPDWLGYEERKWNIRRVKELIKDMIEHNILDDMSEDERYHILLHKGILHLSDPPAMLLKATIKGLNQEQKRQLEEFVHSDSEEIPDLGLGLEGGYTISSEEEDEEEIKTKSTEELAQLTAQDNNEDIDPLEDPIPTPQQILGLRRSEFIDSVCQDIELMQFFVKKSVEKLWKNVFWNTEDEFKIVDDIRQNYNDDKSLFRRNTRQTFLNEYDAVRNTKIPVGYSFPADPKLMQLYVAHKMKTDPSFLNLSVSIKYERMVEQFIVNNEIYLKIQKIAKDKVNVFLTEHYGRKLLEFALAAVVEALRQDPQRELLIKQMPPVKNYDYDPEKVFFPNPYSYSYPNVTEKVLGLSSEMYDKLVKGFLTDVTISTAAGLEKYSYSNNTNFA